MTKRSVVNCMTAAILLGSSITGCQGAGGPGLLNDPNRVPNETDSRTHNARPAILIDNVALSRDALWPLLAEIAGADAVRETVLDHAVAAELLSFGIEITEADVDAERSRLATRLSPGTSSLEAQEVMRIVLEGRGLGPVRLGAMLRRNAGMRKLVAADAVPTAEMIELAHSVRFGPLRETRMVTTNTASEAQNAIRYLRQIETESGLLAAFAETAHKLSTDPSSSLGGQLGPISINDPGLPVSIRSVLSELPSMELSTIIALDRGYAIMLVESDTKAQDITLESVYDELALDVRERQERLLMDRLAQRLLSEHSPSVLDSSLRWSWDRRDGRNP